LAKKTTNSKLVTFQTHTEQLETAEEDKRKLMQELRIERNLRMEAEKSLEQLKQAHGIS
jgi:hypothetical protein